MRDLACFGACALGGDGEGELDVGEGAGAEGAWGFGRGAGEVHYGGSEDLGDGVAAGVDDGADVGVYFLFAAAGEGTELSRSVHYGRV